MDKKNIISLVLGLIIGALVVWLLASFTEFGSTFILKYQGGNKTANTTTALNATNTTNATGGSEKAKGGFDEWLTAVKKEQCGSPRFSGDYNIDGVQVGVPEEIPGGETRYTWDLDMGVGIICPTKGYTLEVKWYGLRGSKNDDWRYLWPFDPDPRFWLNDMHLYKTDTIALENANFKIYRPTFAGWQNEAPGTLYGIWNEMTIKNSQGQVTDSLHYASKATLQGAGYFRWDESQEGTFY